MNLDDIAYCEIHPTLGVARVGNSPDEFFVGPEAPGVRGNPMGGFKDAQGRVKRQAARFRVYGYDKDHNVLGEVTAADAEVTWSVELANKKAAWYKFHGRFHQSDSADNLRNQQVDPADAQARAALMITPGARSVNGPNAGGSDTRFDTGTFLGTPVPLGELRTDEAGRLLVLGGFGHAASAKPNNPLVTYANNDFWHDDVSDGPVTATVTAGGRTIPVTSAWVIVAPPDFAPDTQNLVTLYDVTREVAEQAGWVPPAAEVSFIRDIYPVLARMCGYAWVNASALRGHGEDGPGDFLDPERLARLASNASEDADFRNAVFNRLRTPGAEDVTQANYAFMPQLAGNDGDPISGKPRTWFTVLPGQYERLRRWAAGDFIADGTSAADPVPLADLPVADQPHALVRAALESCVGGPFFPGIEMTFIADEPGTWAGPFRLRENLTAGDITKYMAVPWHADFYECNTHWWPAQRPDDVLPEEQYRSLIRAAQGSARSTELSTWRRPWARGVGVQPVYPPDLDPLPGESGQHHQDRVDKLWSVLREHAGDNDMVQKWSSLGFVVARTGAAGETVLVETERAEKVGLSDREWFYVLQHPDRFPEHAKDARDYAKSVLDDAVATQSDPTCPLTLRPFRYTSDAFEARLQLIYTQLVQDADASDPAADPTFPSRRDLVERIRQFAPFNLLDGAWLRNAIPVGPISGVHSLLFSIWIDEMGGGDPALNHSNLYSDLLHSVGLYLPPVDSYEFAMLPEMLDSAYTVGAFLLAISQHSQQFFPEILGMTVQLEWEVVGVAPDVKLFDYHGISSQFYKMHIGIDNAAAGHGAKARDAVIQYLEEVYNRGGDEAVQQQWQRIWNGYVAFATTGSLGNDLRALVDNPPTPEDRLIDLINRKAPFASLNHDGKQLGENHLNDWFLDPPGLLRELQESGFIQAGDPDNSPFFALTTYTGPMYKVFNDAELELWRQWTRWLAAPSQPRPDLTPLEAMTLLVDTLRPRQTGAVAHARTLITGPDPTAPERTRKESVAWWFTQPTASLLSAIAHPENSLVSPGNPDQSPFIQDLLAPTNRMGQAYAAVVPGTGKTGHDIAVAWIAAGCPLPDLTPPQARVLLSSPVPAERAVAAATAISRPDITGMGAVH